MKKHSFEPIVNENSKVLILGSMPGDESLRTGQYYANPNNQFWKLISCESGLSNQSYSIKLEYLLKNGVAIWDVLQEAERSGSSDGNIKNDIPNDFYAFFRSFPNIKRILFNGTKAASKFKKYYPEYYNAYNCTTLSSSSAAPGKNVKPFVEKQKQWLNALSL